MMKDLAKLFRVALLLGGVLLAVFLCSKLDGTWMLRDTHKTNSTGCCLQLAKYLIFGSSDGLVDFS